MTAYTVLAGADFGAGLWTLLTSDPDIRDHCRHAMGPVWEANHVWLIFVLVVCWTGYPVAFGSLVSTLSAPLLIAGIGIIFRGAAYALRGATGPSRLASYMLGTGSLIAPFALACAVGGIAQGRVPVGNAAGNLLTSWLNPGSVLVGVLAVAFSGFLAAVYLAADAVRFTPHAPGDGNGKQGREMAGAFRTRALYAGLVSGLLALAGLLVMHSSLDLLRVPAVFLVGLSAAAGLATLALCWFRHFALARLTAAGAVAAVVVGWTTAQSPYLLPGLTVSQAASGHSVLVALLIAVICGAVVLVPSLGLLFTLYLRGRLGTPEHPVEGGSAAGVARHASSPPRVRARTAAAVAGLAGGSGLLVFTDAGWEHILGTVLLVICAVSAFLLASPSDG